MSQLQQPRRGSVTRIATTSDISEAATALAGLLGRVNRKLDGIEAKQGTIEAKLDRLLAILQAASAPTTETRRSA